MQPRCFTLSPRLVWYLTAVIHRSMRSVQACSLSVTKLYTRSCSGSLVIANNPTAINLHRHYVISHMYYINIALTNVSQIFKMFTTHNFVTVSHPRYVAPSAKYTRVSASSSPRVQSLIARLWW